MLRSTVRATIINRFLNGNAAYPLGDDTDLLQSGICDSLGLVELAAALESAIPGLRIDDQDINGETLGSVERIVSLLVSKGVE